MAELSELSNKVGYRPAALPSRLPTLTGMRMIAALLVFLLHAGLAGFFASQELGNTYTSVVYQGAWAAVSFFFVLSGFVMTWAARPTDTTKSFYRRRLLKMYPNHILISVVVVLLTFLVVGRNLGTLGEKPGAGTVVTNLLLLQAWSPDWTVRTALNPPSWSLSCELLFYALFPVFFMLIKRIRAERLWAWTAGVAAVAVIGVPLAAATVIPHAVIIPGMGMSLEQFWFIVQFPPVRALEFVLGMLVARLVISGRRPSISLGGAMAWVVVSYVAAPFFPEVFSTIGLMLVPIALLIARMAVADTSKQQTWLASKTMVRLGEISFAFYLWHQVVLMFGDYFMGDNVYSTPVAIAVIVMMFAIALGLSYLQYTFVEYPIMRRWSGRRREPTVLNPVVAVAASGPSTSKRAS